MPAVTSGLTVDIPLVVARRACMVVELGGVATPPIHTQNDLSDFHQVLTVM